MKMGEAKPDLGESTLNDLKRLVAVPSTCSLIAKDKVILGGLVLLLENKETLLVKSGLEILLKCAEDPNHRDTLLSVPGMMDQLQEVMFSSSVAVQELARKILDLLDTPPQTPLRDSTNQHRSRTLAKKRRNSFFLGNGVGKAKIITLHIKGIFARDDVEVCRNSLLTVKGVISITFDYKKQRAVLRTKPDLKPELLAEAVARTMTMTADLVTKNEDGEELIVPLRKKADAAEKTHLDCLPEYPSDDESPIKGDNLLARTNESKAKSSWGLGGFINKLSDMVNTNLYW